MSSSRQARAQGVDQFAVAAAGQVFLQLDHEPQRPVGDEDAVVVVGRVAHRQHAVGQMGELRRQQEVLEEVLLDGRVAAQVGGDAGGEEAVAQPAGPLARGAVHEDVERVLAEGLPGGGEEAVEPLVAARELGLATFGIGVLAQVQIRHLAVAVAGR